MFAQEPISQDPNESGVLAIDPESPQVGDRLDVLLDLLQLPLQILKVHRFVPFNMSYLILMFEDKCDNGLTVIFGNVFGLAAQFMLDLEPFL
jgi:hypothetical protein